METLPRAAAVPGEKEDVIRDGWIAAAVRLLTIQRTK